MYVPQDSMWQEILKTFWFSGWTKQGPSLKSQLLFLHPAARTHAWHVMQARRAPRLIDRERRNIVSVRVAAALRKEGRKEDAKSSVSWVAGVVKPHGTSLCMLPIRLPEFHGDCMTSRRQRVTISAWLRRTSRARRENFYLNLIIIVQSHTNNLI